MVTIPSSSLVSYDIEYGATFFFCGMRAGDLSNLSDSIHHKMT